MLPQTWDVLTTTMLLYGGTRPPAKNMEDVLKDIVNVYDVQHAIGNNIISTFLLHIYPSIH